MAGDKPVTRALQQLRTRTRTRTTKARWELTPATLATTSEPWHL
jgi:hypothetical protein